MPRPRSSTTAREHSAATPAERAALVLFQDEDLLVLNKPSGVATHKTPGCDDACTALTLARACAGRWVYPVHRLDRATSGILVFALSPEMASSMGLSLAQGRWQKDYLAIVRGHLQGQGRFDHPLSDEGPGEARPASTLWSCLAHSTMPWAVRPYATARYSLVQLTPLTGRTHQLRRHCKSLSHPIIGDSIYGDGAHNTALAAHLGLRRLLLHAWSLRLPHPRSGALLQWQAPLEAAMARVVRELFPEFSDPEAHSVSTGLSMSSSSGSEAMVSSTPGSSSLAE